MDHGGGGASYYSVLGVSRRAPISEIRTAYRKLAMKWHPDRWMKDPAAAAEAKRRFQRIQEAYSVLSDEGKRAMYDVGLYDPEEDDEGFSDFMKEMLSMMDSVKSEKKESLEDLQRMFTDLVSGEGTGFGSTGYQGSTRREASDEACKRSRVVGASGEKKTVRRNGSNSSSGTVRC